MSGVIDADDNLRVFAEQFTNTHPDFDFINVGKGKENTDSKIRSKFVDAFDGIYSGTRQAYTSHRASRPLLQKCAMPDDIYCLLP